MYPGGLPASAGKNLHPGFAGEGEFGGVHGGEGALKAKSGGPVQSGGQTTRDFLNDKGYGTGGLDIRSDGSAQMKVVNPDDIKN